MSLSAAAEILDAPLHGMDREFTSVSTDTRTLQPEALFVALKGPNFDGHRFLQVAQQKQAAGALVSEAVEMPLPSILVGDTRESMGRLAAAWRQRKQIPLVAVTGSNGKTTVKEMIAAILALKAPVLATQGNFNNDIGLPLSLLRLRDEQFAVLELGANHPGEIAYLTRIAQPDVALITNAGAAHLVGFVDLDGVARAKGEIFSGLRGGGIAVLNADDPRLPIWRELTAAHRVILFGLSAQAEVRIDSDKLETRWTQQGFHSHFMVQSPAGEFPVDLALAGEHNLRNALAAIAACVALHIPLIHIQQGLAAIQPVPGRLQTRIAAAGLRVIDDSYNANPDSVAAAIEVLRSAPGRRWLVLGDLAELGAQAESLHVQVGESARAAGIDALWSVGQMSRAASVVFGPAGRHFDDREELAMALKQIVSNRDTVLVKGSRSAGLEQVVAVLLQETC